MINRTFRFYTQAFSESGSVSVVAKFNGQQVYSGTIPTVNSVSPTKTTDTNTVGFEYTGPIDITGQIPFELTVTGGTVFFGAVEANYSGNSKIADPFSQVIVAADPEDVWDDVNTNTIETEGKTEVFVNGVKQIRQVQDPSQIGDWWYRIPDAQTLTCDIFVDPNKIITSPFEP
jgi:hypothetical protein